MDEGLGQERDTVIALEGMWGPGTLPLGRWNEPGDFSMCLVLAEVR